MEENKESSIIIYRDESGPEIEVEVKDESVWLTQQQMAKLFEKSAPTINEHIQNIFKEGELKKDFVLRKFGNSEFGLVKPKYYYNLDIIISVGYRVKSKRGTQFRIWATQKLKSYLLKGYLFNEKRLQENQDAKLKELEQAHKIIQQALETRRLEGYEKELLNIITDYATTWFLLNKYDEGSLVVERVTTKSKKVFNYEEIKSSIERFKKRLSTQGQASDLFGKEVSNKLNALIGNIHQTYGNKDLYPSIEEKAAHLFYFSIKDHPFVDGNKRIGSLLFILYLVENHYLYNKRGERKINDNALVALALLVAESKAEQKDVMVRLIVNLINKK